MIENRLVGLYVNIGDKEHANALGLVQFFYPDYKVMQQGDIYPNSAKLIHVEGISDKNALNWLINSDRKVIYATKTHKFDFDFSDNLEVLKFVYAKWDIEAEYLYSEDELENIRRMELFDFYNFIKPRWISKDICLCDDLTNKVKIHSVIGQDFNEILRFCDYITSENANRLEMEFVQFIETARIKNIKKSKAYSRYYALFRRFNNEFDNDYIALALAKYREMTNNKRFKLIWLLSQFSYKNSEGV